jgi:hypothetical protein
MHLSLEEAMDLLRDRQILKLETMHQKKPIYYGVCHVHQDIKGIAQFAGTSSTLILHPGENE